MPNMRDVAKLAGVTPMTVSRVINNSGYVKDSTRRRVEKAIDELNYVPNLLGQSLRFKETMTIGLVISDISNPYWTQIIRGVEQASSETEYSLILCNSQNSEKIEKENLEKLVQKQIDGILIAPIRNEANPINFVKTQDVPIVVIGYPMHGVEVDVVRCDTEVAAYEIVRHLTDLGHHRIAMLSGPDHIVTARERVMGYRRALADAGIVSEDDLVQFGDFTLGSGFKMAEDMLNLTPLPTAVVTANNFIAIGATKALRKAGFQIPDDMSIVTFDGPPSDFVLDPFFTMVSQPGIALGRTAAEILFKRIMKEFSFPVQDIVLPTEIIINKSTASTT